MNDFTNPNSSVPLDQKVRIQSSIAKTDHNFLFYTLHPGHGSLETVTNLLYVKLVKSLKQHNITSPLDRLKFERFLADCIIRLPEPDSVSGSTVGGAVTKTSPRNERTRTKGVRSKAKVASGKQTDIQGGGVGSGDGFGTAPVPKEGAC